MAVNTPSQKDGINHNEDIDEEMNTNRRRLLQTYDTSQIWINELHYRGGFGEYVEVAGVAGLSTANFKIYVYQKAGQSVYNSWSLPVATIQDEQNGFGAVLLDPGDHALHSHDDNGIALVYNDAEVIQFLSYSDEGNQFTLTAADGPAIGMTSTDIGAYEAKGDEDAGSLQLCGTGNKFEDFAFQKFTTVGARSQGSINSCQTMTATSTKSPTTTTTKSPTLSPTSTTTTQSPTTTTSTKSPSTSTLASSTKSPTLASSTTTSAPSSTSSSTTASAPSSTSSVPTTSNGSTSQTVSVADYSSSATSSSTETSSSKEVFGTQSFRLTGDGDGGGGTTSQNQIAIYVVVIVFLCCLLLCCLNFLWYRRFKKLKDNKAEDADMGVEALPTSGLKVVPLSSEMTSTHKNMQVTSLVIHKSDTGLSNLPGLPNVVEEDDDEDSAVAGNRFVYQAPREANHAFHGNAALIPRGPPPQNALPQPPHAKVANFVNQNLAASPSESEMLYGAYATNDGYGEMQPGQIDPENGTYGVEGAPGMLRQHSGEDDEELYQHQDSTTTQRTQGGTQQ
eukprot:CAMPEP_0202706760 /NCGR_PEP_ID=MMETSP1385-20130828/19140_1 /ASSEMBLY_ACC=CAM_ASM_000861 /TAXON_ID=933848 /ORGANISM="Elphidium margaritaceum" /LENGTH=562 /DNA_ID=CAMNT_0049365303 /DNA_START=19 /DNA_END=1707 /DNA_ORIENTATION=-